MAHRDYEIKLYSFCYRLTGNSHVAQKLAIESIEKLDKAYKPNDELFKETLKKIAQIFLNKYQQCYPAQKGKVLGPSATIQRILQKISPKERLILLLHDYCQMSYLEISRIIEDEDIKFMCNSGRMQLCQHLRDNGIILPECP